MDTSETQDGMFLTAVNINTYVSGYLLTPTCFYKAGIPMILM